MTEEFKYKEFIDNCSLLGDEYIFEVDDVRGFYSRGNTTYDKGEVLIQLRKLLDRDEWVSQKCPTGLPSQIPGTYRFLVTRECFNLEQDKNAITHDWLWDKSEVKQGISSSYYRKNEGEENVFVYIYTNNKHFPNITRKISYVCNAFGALESVVLLQYHVREEHEMKGKKSSKRISSVKKPTIIRRRRTEVPMKRQRIEEEEDTVIAPPRNSRRSHSDPASAVQQEPMEEGTMAVPETNPPSAAPVVKENFNEEMENVLDFYNEGKKTFRKALNDFLSVNSPQLMRIEIDKMEILRSIDMETKVSLENILKESRIRKEAVLNEMQMRKDEIIRHVQVKMEPIDPDEMEIEPIRIKEEPHW